jgi:outer membrane murein-binding lipoprotein Lpp
MADQPESISLHHLQALRTDVQAMRDQQALDSRKIGALAENVVRIGARLDQLAGEVHGLRNDFQAVALAFDEHAARLGAIERRLPSE